MAACCRCTSLPRSQGYGWKATQTVEAYSCGGGKATHKPHLPQANPSTHVSTLGILPFFPLFHMHRQVGKQASRALPSSCLVHRGRLKQGDLCNASPLALHPTPLRQDGHTTAAETAGGRRWCRLPGCVSIILASSNIGKEAEAVCHSINFLLPGPPPAHVHRGRGGGRHGQRQEKM